MFFITFICFVAEGIHILNLKAEPTIDPEIQDIFISKLLYTPITKCVILLFYSPYPLTAHRCVCASPALL